jgi:hypothetical protein
MLKLVLVCLEIVLISAYDRCTDWDFIGLEIILGKRWNP